MEKRDLVILQKPLLCRAHVWRLNKEVVWKIVQKLKVFGCFAKTFIIQGTRLVQLTSLTVRNTPKELILWKYFEKCTSWRTLCHGTQCQLYSWCVFNNERFNKTSLSKSSLFTRSSFYLNITPKSLRKQYEDFYEIISKNLYIASKFRLTIHDIGRNVNQIQHVVGHKTHNIHEGESILIPVLCHENSNSQLRMKRINDFATAKLSWGGKR